MKKIVSAVALASVAFGAFAADLTVKSEIKYKPTIAQFDNSKNNSDKTFATQGAGLTNDATTIQLKQDNVEVYGKYDFKDNSLSMNVAYGKLSWGNATITAGKFESRFSDRVTTDQNDLSLIEQNDGRVYVGEKSATASTRTKYTVCGTKKLGINPNLGLVSKAGVDADNVTTLQGTKVNSFVVDYTLNDVGPGKLLLKAVAKTNAGAWYSADDKDESHTTNDSGFSFEAAYTHEAFKGDFVVNLDQDNVGSWGLYVSPTAIDGLKATLGFTYAWDKHTTSTAASESLTLTQATKDLAAGKASGYLLDGTDASTSAITKGTWYYNKVTTAASSTAYDITAWAIDARARYAINDQLAAGVYANVTSLTNYKANDAKMIDGAVTALDVVANVNYKVNDLAKVFVEGEYAAKSISNKEKKGDQSYEVGSKYGDTSLVFQGGVILTPAKGATITTAVRAIMGGFGADSDHEFKKGTTIVIPLSFKTSL